MNLLLTTFRQTAQARRLVGVLYVLTLALGLPLALAMYGTANAEAAGSLGPLALLEGFDFTVWGDLMAQSGRVFKALQRTGWWMAALYWLLSAGLAGGVLTYLYALNAAAQRPGTPAYRLAEFWRGAGRYFGRLLGLAVLTATFALLLFGVPFIIGVAIAGSMGVTDHGTEPEWFFTGFAGFLVGALFATFALCIGDYAKVRMVRDDVRNPFRAFGQAGRYVLRHKRATYGRYVLLILAGALLFGIYFLVDALILMRNWPTILLMLVVQQAVIFGRAWLKVWTLATAARVAENWPAPMMAAAGLPLMPESTTFPTPETPASDERPPVATLSPQTAPDVASPSATSSPAENDAPRVPPPLPEP